MTSVFYSNTTHKNDDNFTCALKHLSGFIIWIWLRGEIALCLKVHKSYILRFCLVICRHFHIAFYFYQSSIISLLSLITQGQEVTHTQKL